MYIKENNIKYVLVADTHQTNEQILDDNITLINPGSVGLSDEDLGNGTGTYTILTLNNNKWDSENRTFNYYGLRRIRNPFLKFLCETYIKDEITPKNLANIDIISAKNEVKKEL